MNLFRSKSVSIEEQLDTLRGWGQLINDRATVEDLFIFESREKLEKQPYKGIIEALGYEIERSPFTPVCMKLWMCDYERIEDHGAYTEIIERLEHTRKSSRDWST